MKKRGICRVCKTEGEFEVYKVKEMMKGTRQEFPYILCANCGCLQIEKVPENIENYYYDDYYSYQTPPMKKVIAKEELKNIAILDVGCGAGLWLCNLADSGYSDLWGCDPFIKEDLCYDNGVRIKKCTIHEINKKFDLIVLRHSFEHMTDPLEVFITISNILKDRGVCKIAIPVVPNIAFDNYKENWYQLDAPRHIFIHSPQSMAYLAEQANLKIIKTEYISNNGQFIRSILYEMGIPFEEQTNELINKYFSKEDVIKYDTLAERANKEKCGDQAIFYLEKNKEKDKIDEKELLVTMGKAITYLIQEREKGQLEASAYLLDDLLEAQKLLCAKLWNFTNREEPFSDI